MKFRLFLITLFILILTTFTSFLNAENSVKESENEESEISEPRLVILPFYNYSDSDMKYLSNYISELIKKNFPGGRKTEISDADDIRESILASGITPEKYYDFVSVHNFLTSLNARIGIYGRYIIHGNTIKIDIRAIDTSTGIITEGKSFDAKLDDRFLDSMERFAEGRASWIKSSILKESLTTFEGTSQTFLKNFSKLKETSFGVLLKNRWVFAILILVFFYIMSILTRVFFDNVLKELALRTETRADDDIVDMSKKPVKFIVIFAGIKLSLMSLKLPSAVASATNNLSNAVLIVLVSYIFFKSSDIIIHAWGKKVAERIDPRIDNELVPLFVNIARVIIISIGTIMILSMFEIDIAPLIASLGIVGFAIGFAIKDSLANIIGGIILILDHTFAVGDKVTIDNDTGYIKHIGLRNTMLMTFDNEIILIPNNELINKKFKNYVLPDPVIRVVVDFGVAYGTDVERVEEVVFAAIKSMENVREQPEPQVVFISMGDFSLNFKAKIWIDDYGDQYIKKAEMTKVVYNALNKAGISIPFPTHTIYMEKDEGKD